MSHTRSSSFLRQWLTVDAIVSGATGIAMLLLATPLESLLGVPAALLRYAGLSLLPFVAFVGYLATREQISRSVVWVVIACNAMWTIDSVVLLFTSWVDPTLLGYVFIVGQALIVAVFAEMQYVGLRRDETALA